MKNIWKWGGISLAFLCLCAQAQAQMTAAQTSQLRALSARFQSEYQQERLITRQKAARLGFPLEIRRGEQVLHLDYFAGDEPVYIGDDNEEAAETVSASEVKTGGSLGLNLSGAGQTLGIWEAGGGVRTTHQELSGRATQSDAPATNTNHATHVAGTMIASGVDPDARGFSSGANLICFDAANDNTEMSNAAANVPIRVSNHSYGAFAGWDFAGGAWTWYGAATSAADWKFGAYDAGAQSWDNIATAAPFYLIVKSAGNDRNDFAPAAGTMHSHSGGPATQTDTHGNDAGTTGFDCIPTDGTAKNILTVGAVNKISGGYTGPGSVTMSTFSGWGPTDDGRIKPDVVAPGVGLYSSFSTGDAAYGTLDGTSMAAPSTAGSVGLLLEHWANTLGGVPRATTMKGLLIASADEAGANVGPDYSFGWGMINVADAAELITIENYDGCQQYLEGSVGAGETFEFNLHSNGTHPLKVTLVWADPASGAVNSGTLNPAGASDLVNNLDLRVAGSSSTFLPWVLNPANPAAAATQGDNNRDNVEQVLVLTPAAGDYTVRVVAPGTLTNGPQNFSLWFLGNDAMVDNRTVSAVVLNTSQVIAVRQNLTFGPAVSVVSPADVRAYAGTSIRLTPGFQASAGSKFLAQIRPGGGCGISTGNLKADNYTGSIMGLQAVVDNRQEAAAAAVAGAAARVQLWPNPASDRLQVQLDLEATQSLRLQLLDVRGRMVKVLQSPQVFEKGNIQLQYGLEELPAGLYFLQINADHWQESLPVVVQH
jgi:trimeric autotransporter adhesin